MKKNIYLVKDDEQTFPYLKESLAKIEYKAGETTDSDGKVTDIMEKLDTPEKVEKFMPGGKWVEAGFLSDVLGKHEAKVQRLLAQPNEELSEEYFEQEEGHRAKWLAEHRQERFDSVMVSVVCTGYDGNLLTEEEVEELPYRVKDLLVAICSQRFGGNHSAFFQNVCRRLDS